MFFINRGAVEVVSEDGSVVFATMTEGKFFGEISLVFSCPRTASIRFFTISVLFIHVYYIRLNTFKVNLEINCG